MSIFSDFNYEDLFKNKSDNINKEDKWKVYLFQTFRGNLKQRLNEILEKSDYKLFYSGLQYEYGYDKDQNYSLSLKCYEEGAKANSIDFLSMIRLYDIYHTSDYKFYIVPNKDLELIYLLKSFTYMPVSLFISDISKSRFPFNIKYAITNYFNNSAKRKKIFEYLNQLINSGKYADIISQDDFNLIKGFIEGYVIYTSKQEQNSLDLLVALSLEGNCEAYIRLIIIYLEILSNTNPNNENAIAVLKTKIYELFLPLIKMKCYRIYEYYGLFLYNKMLMFDEALNIFKEGYEHYAYNCAIYYFHALTKSDNQSIYDTDNFNSQKFIDIFQTLIDAFICGKYVSLEFMFDFFHILSKRYNLCSQLSDKYMKYLDEISIICLSFIDENNGIENIKKYNPFNIDNIQHSCYHALAMSYIYGLTNKIKKNLLKAEECLNKASELNEYSQPYYAMYIYRVRKKLFKLGAFEDINDLIQIGNEVFKIYEKYKDFKNYGNSFYYMFGKLYEKGIGTPKNNKMAFLYYQKGCRSLLNLSDSFIIVYKRYLSLKITKSMVMKSSANNNIPSFNVNLKLSTGSCIRLNVNNNMTIGDIKNELYKKRELQNLKINVILIRANSVNDDVVLRDLHLANDENIVVVVGQNNPSIF